MDKIWSVHYYNAWDEYAEDKLYRNREDAEKFIFSVEYKYLKRRLNEEIKWLECKDYSDRTLEEKEHSRKLYQRGLKYLENVLESEVSWEEKNKKLYENRILWKENDEDNLVNFGSIISCNDAPITNLKLLNVE